MKNLHPAIGLLSVSLLSSSVFAQTDPSIMLTPWVEGQQVQLRGDAFYSPTESEGTSFDVDLTIYDAKGRFLLDPESSFQPTIGFAYTHFELDTSDPLLADDYADASVGFGGSFGDVDLGELLGGTWQMGFSAGLGYSGTNLFGEDDGWYGKADVFAIKPIDRDTRWLVGINYDGNRVFLPDVPLPAVSYFGRASESVTYAVGIPFSRLTYRPDEKWTVDIRSVLFFSFNGSITYQATESVELFAAYIRRSDAFTDSDSAFDNRRFIFSQQRVELGANIDLGDRMTLTIASGFAFDQEFERGYDVRDPSSLRELDDSGYIRAGIELRY